MCFRGFSGCSIPAPHIVLAAERDTNAYNLVVSQTSDDGQTHLTRLQSYLRQHSTLVGKVHLPFSNQSSHFLPQPAFSISSFGSHSSFYLQPHYLMPFSRCDHPLSSTQCFLINCGRFNASCLPHVQNM